MTAAVGVVGAALVSPLAPPSVEAMPSAGLGAPASAPAPGYLALGDSITFGLREGSTVPLPNFRDASSFVGYPEDIGAALGWQVTNAACPGETAGGFINVNAMNHGCVTSATGGASYSAGFPLHVSYHGAQLHYAVGYLRAHPDTKLVSLMIGVNDLLACVDATADLCESEQDDVLRTVSDNVTQILHTIRKSGRYAGQIIVVNYYTLNDASSVGNPSLFDKAGITKLNRAVDHAATPFGVTFAQGELAFEFAALHSGGNSCVAGLLTQFKGGSCGIHPSAAGQAVLALAVERVIRR